MLVDLLATWGHQANVWILSLFEFIFPEYPKIGVIAFITAGIIFLYYLVRGKAISAFKMALSTLVTFCVLLFVVHWLIKLYRVVV